MAAASGGPDGQAPGRGEPSGIASAIAAGVGSVRGRVRPIHAAALALVALVVLVGAVERRPSLKDDFDPERDKEFADAWDELLHIAYWEKWGSFEREACQAMVDEFNRRQLRKASGRRIFVHFINTSQVDRKAMLAIMGGDPPEVVGLWSTNVPPFAEAGALMELERFMASSEFGKDGYKDRYIPNYLKLGTYRGRVHALPTTPASLGLYYNKAHFRERAADLRAAGLDPERPPRTTDELDRYAEVFNVFSDAKGGQSRPVRMGFLPTEPGWFNWTWGYYFGGKLFDEERGLITADDPRNIDALLWTKRYAERYGREKMLQFRSGFGNFDSPQNAFIDGRVTMEIQGVWFSNFIRRHRPHMEFGVAPPPAAAGIEGPVSLVECDVIAIPKGCRHPEAAWEFVDFTQREGSAILCRLQGKHMPLKKPPANFREGHPNLELPVFERLAKSARSFIPPRIRVWREYQHELDKAFEHVWNWPVPDGPLEGLTSEARRRRVDELCRGEIAKTLADVRERMQRQYDAKRERDELRRAQ